MNTNQISTENGTAKPATVGQLALFFLLAYLIGWGVFAFFSLLARQAGIENGQTLLAMTEAYQFNGANLPLPPSVLYLLSRLADFSFSIAGVVMIALTAGRNGLAQLWQRLTHWRLSWHWYLLGLLPLVLYAIATAAAGAIPSFEIGGAAVTTALFSLQAGFFVSLFLRGLFGEEFGLRGFALPNLQGMTSPALASLIIGVLWAAWHLPVLIGRDPISVAAFCLLAIGLSFLFTGLFNASGGSLIPVLLFHATQNWEEGFETFFPALIQTDWELISTFGLLLAGGLSAIWVWRNSAQSRHSDSSTNPENG